MNNGKLFKFKFSNDSIRLNALLESREFNNIITIISRNVKNGRQPSDDGCCLPLTLFIHRTIRETSENA